MQYKRCQVSVKPKETPEPRTAAYCTTFDKTIRPDIFKSVGQMSEINTRSREKLRVDPEACGKPTVNLFRNTQPQKTRNFIINCSTEKDSEDKSFRNSFCLEHRIPAIQIYFYFPTKQDKNRVSV